MARRRYQQGTVERKLTKKHGEHWSGRYIEDERQADGTVLRRHRRVVLGDTRVVTKPMAKRKLAAILESVNAIGAKPKSVCSLAQFVAKWETVAREQYKPGTWSNLMSAKRIFLERLGAKQLEEIQVESLQMFVSSLQKQPGYTHSLLNFLRAVWRAARAWGYVKHDPFDGLMLPRIPRVEKRFFSAEDVRRIIEAAPEPDRTIYWIAAQTGLRIGEIMALRWPEVNLDAGTISVNGNLWRSTRIDVKTNASRRIVPISSNLREHLAAFKESGRADGYLFVNAKGKVRAADAMRRHLHDLLGQLGIPDAGFHAFRHTSATLLDRMNAPMSVRQRRLGHTKADVTLGIYTHAVAEDASRVAEQFDEYITPVLPKTERQGISVVASVA